MNPELFLAFLVITFVLVVTPGPIVTLLIATGASGGVRPALATVAGTVTGNAVLVAAIAFGITWVLNTSAVLFEIIRWAGAAYLIWLGTQMWRNAGMDAAPPPRRRVHFVRGFLVAHSNPKAVAFFTAFLPQFVDPTLPAGFQLVVTCTVATVMGAMTDAAWAVAAGLGRVWFVQPGRARLLGRLSGALLIGGGIWLSLARRPA